MASPPRWTKTKFLAWFEHTRPLLIRLTTARFGAELQASGFSAEDALHTALERSICKRHYRSCRTTMEGWFLQDVKWAIRDALREAKRTVPLDPARGREGRLGRSEMQTDGDDTGQIEFAIASDEVDDLHAVWMDCDRLPPFIKPDDVEAAKEWADYQLELRHRAARRRSIHRPGSRTFSPKVRALRDRRAWKDALRDELRRYRTRLDALQVEGADTENAIFDGLARCTGRSRKRERSCPPAAGSVSSVCPLTDSEVIRSC